MKQRIPYFKSIGFKFSSVIFGGTLTVICLILVLSANRQHQSAIIYQDRKNERQESFKIISDLEQQPLKGLTIEDTYYDEMVSFISKPTPTFENDVLKAQLDSYHASAIWTYNSKFRLVSNTNNFDKSRTNFDLGLDQASIAKVFGHSYLAHFYRQTNNGILEVYGATVHGSDDPDHKTPNLGYFFVARQLDATVIHDLEAKTKDSVAVEAVHGIAKSITVPPASSGIITFYNILYDETGQAVARFNVSYHSAAIANLFQSLRGVIIVVIASCIVLTIVIYLILQRIIITPINSIYGSLLSNQFTELDKLAIADTELGRIAALIKKAAEQKEALANSALETQKARGNLEARTKDLESINALMVNRELKMVELKRQNESLKKAT